MAREKESKRIEGESRGEGKGKHEQRAADNGQ